MSLFKRGKIWWYEFWFAGRRIQESAKTNSKTVAKLAEQRRRREMEEGFNSIEDHRQERIRTIREVAKEYLEGYVLRNRSSRFAQGAMNHLIRLLGAKMIVDVDENTFSNIKSNGWGRRLLRRRSTRRSGSCCVCLASVASSFDRV